ncbi:uncharacterized protein G2W53_015413 [Senna tora]|uniref:Uncharacterized protein n=1 Tax=Senna tora TaxID=362788 RepID=A0A834WVI9_9FABA|nr:uncharacterized protein G2W53_015413 [Senna tora]
MALAAAAAVCHGQKWSWLDYRQN